MTLKEILPFLIPLIIGEFVLLFFALRHIFTHTTYKHGNRIIWIAITIAFMNYVGPILYFIFGKEDN